MIHVTPIRTLLIANRGEIACRIIRTARAMGVRSVAVFSDADRESLHVAMADAAVHIGASSPRASYLNIPVVVEAARRAGADAVHPGYGFLSENPDFVEACEAAGLVFVGPPARAMRAMGSKAPAKALMARAGVPLLPGYHEADQDPALLAREAARVGFPVVIKATAGGGGRGMRVVRDAEGFASALDSARREAAGAFGDDRVLVERYLDRPRHIEVQVFADRHGNAVHLFERDCSAQRRHQKVMEEAPAPGLDAGLRAAMGRAAVEAARAVGYVGAGTVEFVVDASGFYFLEMNTRLQVEHPVTEAITGTDLVEWQLRVAGGERLPLTQADLAVQGHAIEARIYAEDPARDYAPSVGRLLAFRTPDADVRVETGVRAGDTITTHYDAMIAKLVVHAPDRAEAIAKLRAALAGTEIAGVTTNLDLLDRIAAHPDFAAGGIDTGFIGREAATLLAGQAAPTPTVLAVASACVLEAEARAAAAAAARSGDPHSPWHARDGFWLNAAPWRSLRLGAGDAWHSVGVRVRGAVIETSLGIVVRDVARDGDGALAMTLDGIRRRVFCTATAETLVLRIDGATWRLTLPPPASEADDAADASARLVAPLPGQVTQVSAEAGQTVARGDVLVVLEAMKTVFRLAAPADGTVAEVAVRAGEMVQDGQVLVTFETAD
jgi:3-methylcrotonyl-CoA carboxylase alpha subunit